MSETCYVTQVRLLAQPVKPAANKRFSLASVSWPFLPQVPHDSNKDGTVLRQRRLVPVSVVSAANVAAAIAPPSPSLQSKVRAAANVMASSIPSWPAFALLLLRSLRFSLTQSLLSILVRASIVVLLCEMLAVLLSLALAAKVPLGLLFMVAALLLLGYIAARAISHDSAAIRRRKSSTNLLKKTR